tara:strand:+ start:942 stop:1349 length:408 start_codon:yes stop_codon:yes gene_type:complete
METISRWVIYFIDRKSQYWFDFFTKPGFRHCFIYGYDPLTNKWIAFDYALNGVFINILNTKQMLYTHHQILKKHKATAIVIESENKNKRLFNWVPMYCVSAIKYMIGMKNMFVITPYQLFCALKKKISKDNIYFL